MANGIDRNVLAAEGRAAVRSQVTLANAARAAIPPLLFGFRLWASVCLALFVAFWLELDNPYWAGASAAIVCQPYLGASLRKSRYRIIGTLVGGTTIVVMTAWFPQDRIGFLVGLAVWGGVCAFAATLFRNFASYAAALAGYTAAIIGADTLGATGGASSEVFMLAVTRTSEVWIGILCAGAVLALTDFGGAAEKLAGELTAASTEIAARFGTTLRLAGSDSVDAQQPARRELIRRVAGLNSMIEEAIGESSTIRYHSRVLQGAIDGLFVSLAAWRSIAARLIKIPPEVADEEANAVLGCIPEEMRSAPPAGQATFRVADPIALRRRCKAAVRTLIAMPASTASLRLLADQTANVMVGFAMVLEATAVLVANPVRSHSPSRGFKIYVPDWLPSLVSAGRAFVAIGAAELFWVLTAWPDGGSAIEFVAFAVLLLSPRAELAFAEAIAFMLGTMAVIPIAAAIKFALLPGLESFPAFCIALAAFLIPLGIAMAATRQHASLVICAAIFMPVLQPTNEMSYDTMQFYNSALGLFVGVAAAPLSFLLVPPLSPSLRTRRLVNLTLRDLRRLAVNRLSANAGDWQGYTFGRLAALPEQAEPLERAQLLAAQFVGTEIIHLRHDAAELDLRLQFDAALRTFAEGNSTAATAQLTRLDHHLASTEQIDTHLAVRTRGRILAICDAFADHRAYFDTGASA
jgi:uncharacterized membrane protein YccC